MSFASLEAGLARDTSAPSSFSWFFSAKTFSFIPGLLQGEKSDWSVMYFSVLSMVLSLFYTNSMLPGGGTAFCRVVLHYKVICGSRGAAWLSLSALLFVALIEVKILTAAHIMCSLGFAAIVYLLVFRDADLFKVAALSAALTAPLVLSVYLGNKSGANITTAFAPWLYVSDMTEMVGLKNSVDWHGCFHRDRPADVSRRLPGPSRVVGVFGDLQSDISSRPEIRSEIRSCVFRGDRCANRTDLPHRARWLGIGIQQQRVVSRSKQIRRMDLCS